MVLFWVCNIIYYEAKDCADAIEKTNFDAQLKSEAVKKR